MSQIIAGIYEIQKQIGAGGGGVVYLGRHLRLEKQIVLKADKRTLNTKSEILRREVDMLKGLSHMYIPQVYDFVQENGVVYTVMDFIEGESMDRLLARGEIPSQPQVIRWSCQLLNALIYLHSRPPHGILHGDIKPANIMLRPNGDICLIDYNIALALGEDGAVRVGGSRGYASPEHYGAEDGTAQAMRLEDEAGMQETESWNASLSERIYGSNSGGKPGESYSGQKKCMLDVRSDIYSLGATLYHLLSGQRPPQDAARVKALGADICSPAVSAIVQKAMALDPDMRYQSAAEMLEALHCLYRQDKRSVWHRRHAVLTAVLSATMFLTGGVCCFIGLKQLEQIQTALTLAEYSANEYDKGNISGAVEMALRAIPKEKQYFGVPATAQAQKALTDALGVYDLADGFKALDKVELPAAPFGISVSPGGSCLAVVYSGELAVYDVETRQKLTVLPVQDSAMSDVVFVDETYFVYAGDRGVTAYDLESQNAIWIGEEATMLAVSGDGTKVAAVNRDESHAVIYRTEDGAKLMECTFHGQSMDVAANDIFADPGNHILELNEDGSMLAVSFRGGGLRIFDLQQPDDDLIMYDESDYMCFNGGFCGKYFAFAANRKGESLFGLIDTEEAVYLGGYDAKEPFLLQTNENGIYLSNGNLLEYIDPVTMEEKELAYTKGANITAFAIDRGYIMTVLDEGSISFFDSGANMISTVHSSNQCDFTAMVGIYAVLGDRNEPVLQFFKLENHEDSQIMSYDAHYAHDEARISQDGMTAMLYNYQNFRIYDKEGNILKRMELPDAEHIYDQQFVRRESGSWLEVIWYDGTVRRYSAKDGELISEISDEPPSADLYEEFYTDRYRVASSLHSAPEVYDRRSGRKLAVLEEDSYLTYVTQAGDYIITEYVSADGKRYGILLDEKFQKLAYLPGLCDFVNDMFIFDYNSGSLRQSRLYSLRELKALGDIYLTNEKGEKGR